MLLPMEVTVIASHPCTIGAQTRESKQDHSVAFSRRF